MPFLYQVPKLNNLNFCCCTVCFLRGGVLMRGYQSWEDNGLDVLDKTPGLYQVPKLINLNFLLLHCVLSGLGVSKLGGQWA